MLKNFYDNIDRNAEHSIDAGIDADIQADIERNVGYDKRMIWGAALLLIGLLGWLLGGAQGTVLASPAAADDMENDALPLRLHIIANSDSPQDQTYKLLVRDAVVEYLTPLLAGAETREEAAAIVRGELAALVQLASGITGELGYGASAELGSFAFPDRRYGALFLPAGEYPALRLRLGEAAGRNWWCVIFPPLCFVDECGELSSEDSHEDSHSEGSLAAGDVQVRLKFAEIFE